MRLNLYANFVEQLQRVVTRQGPRRLHETVIGVATGQVKMYSYDLQPTQQISLAMKTLQEYGYKVQIASDAKTALDIFQTENMDFQLILSDIILPDQSGMDLAQHFTKARPDIPILLTSGYTE